MFLLAVVFASKVFSPIAVLFDPVVFDLKASLPTAVLFPPVVLFSKLSSPTATLLALLPAPLPTL